MSPRVLHDVQGPYRFFFFSNEGSEPPHVHVRRERKLAKFWLKPVVLATSHGFAAHELTDLQTLVEEREATILEAWYDFHGPRTEPAGD